MASLWMKLSVFFAQKELKVHIAKNSDYQNAKLLYAANLERNNFDNRLKAIIDNPLGFGVDEVEHAFKFLQELQFRHAGLLDGLLKKGVSNEDFRLNHIVPFQECYLIWLATVGLAINPSSLNDLRYCWLVFSDRANLLEGIVDEDMRAMRDEAIVFGGNLEDVSRDEILAKACYVPSFIRGILPVS